MYARLVKFPATPGKRTVVVKLAHEVNTVAESLPGFVSSTYMYSEEDNEYASMTLWSDKEQAQNGTKVLGREFGMQLAELATGPVEMRIMEVFEPVGK